MKRKVVACLSHVCALLCGCSKVLNQRKTNLDAKASNVCFWILQMYECILVHLFGDEQNHENSGHGDRTHLKNKTHLEIVQVEALANRPK